MLDHADRRARLAHRDVEGSVVAVITNVIARHALVEALPRFHARYPRIQIDLRDDQGEAGAVVSGVDVYVTMGWNARKDLVCRQAAQTRLWVVAAPEYWSRYGLPTHPSELTGHNCFALRSTPGTVMDLWVFARGDEQATAAVSDWLVVSNSHRDVAIDMLLAGQGVMRTSDWSLRKWVEAGRLVRALERLGGARVTADELDVSRGGASHSAGTRVRRFRRERAARHRRAARAAGAHHRGAAVDGAWLSAGVGADGAIVG
jgi:DNA-binding transcriptional LysR family regulator